MDPGGFGGGGAMKGWRMLVGALALVAALTAARPAEAGYLEDAGWGALTVLTNVFYMPAKLGYATLGGLTGGFAFALTGGDLQTAETVWVTSMEIGRASCRERVWMSVVAGEESEKKD